MDNFKTIVRENAQKKYRTNQSNRGFVRLELQITAKTKQRFEKMVEAAADEYDYPWDKRRRVALARAEMFDTITKGSLHEFTELKQQIASQQEEIATLAPSFFLTEKRTTALPSAINSLPDDSQHLKALLAQLLQEAQSAKLQAKEQKRRANQFEQLYNVQYERNEKLEAQIREHDENIFD